MTKLFSASYRIGFDVWGLLLFLAVMIPNFIWFAVPAPNDLLRRESVTGTVDVTASVFQVIMVIAMTFLINITRKTPMARLLFIGIIAATLLYYIGWVLYYKGVASAIVILDLSLAPCLAFILFCIARGNIPALVAAAVFTVCHVIFGIVNFII